MILRYAVLIWLSCIICLWAGENQVPLSIEPLLSDFDQTSAELILNTTRARITDSNHRVDALYKIKQDNLRSAPFEVGYLVQVIQEKYRRMIDKYNTSDYMKIELYFREHLIYLTEIEHHFWEIEHLINMLHEIERKYEIPDHEDYSIVNKTMDWPARTTAPTYSPIPRTIKRLSNKKYLKRLEGMEAEAKKLMGKGTTSAATTDELLDQLSWGLRLKIWAVNQTVESFGPDSEPHSPTQFDFAVPTEVSELGMDGGRRVGIQSLVSRRTGSTLSPTAVDGSGDENKMRLKLFRLMYETVRDSDLKVKRAELVQKNYDAFPSFKVGMFMGDLQDKYTVMTDIASTLKKFHSVWKPIEHINAYEQIANAGIEISQLIEHLRAAGKRAEKEREHGGSPPPPISPPGRKRF